MSDEEELGAALTDALWTMLADVEPSPRLRDWVRSELRSAPERMAKRRRLRRRVLATLTSSTAAIAAIIVLAFGTGASATFAVVRLPGGVVSITLGQIEGVSGAETKLRALGIRSIVVIPVKPGCKSHLQISYIPIGLHRNSQTVSVTSSEIPTGYTDVIAAKEVSRKDLELALTRVKGAAPSCVRSMKPAF